MLGPVSETDKSADTIPAVKKLLLGFVRYLFFYLFFLGPCFAQNATPSPAKQKMLWQKLEADIHEVDQHLDGVMGVAIEDLTSDDHLFLHEDEVFAQASSIKIAVLADLYLQAQQGKLKLTDLYTVQSSDLVPDSDIMGGLTPGVTRLTLRDLATMMVAVSDNSATNVLIDRVGMAERECHARFARPHPHAPAPQDDGPASCKGRPGEHFHAARNDDAA